MTATLDPVFAGAIRTALVTAVTSPRRPRRWGTLVVLGAVAGVGVFGGAGAAAASGWLIPGAQEVVTFQVSPPAHVTHVGSAVVALGSAPKGANEIHLSLRCLSPGTFTFQDGASVTCGASDVGTVSALTTYDLAASPGQKTTSIGASAGASWSLTATWIRATTTAWGTNANGQTYGVINKNGTPDLIAVATINGQQGYVSASALAQADGDDAAATFTSPAQALAWQKAHAGQSVLITIYASDGVTKLGTFAVEQ